MHVFENGYKINSIRQYIINKQENFIVGEVKLEMKMIRFSFLLFFSIRRRNEGKYSGFMDSTIVIGRSDDWEYLAALFDT